MSQKNIINFSVFMEVPSIIRGSFDLRVCHSDVKMIGRGLCQCCLVILVCLSFAWKNEAKATDELLSDIKLDVKTSNKNGKSSLETDKDLIKPVYEKSENDRVLTPVRKGRFRFGEGIYRKKQEIRRKVVRFFLFFLISQDVNHFLLGYTNCS